MSDTITVTGVALPLDVGAALLAGKPVPIEHAVALARALNAAVARHVRAVAERETEAPAPDDPGGSA
jgi:hypothetical protein